MIMLTRMTDADWAIVVEAFRAARSRRGDKGQDDRKFLETLHYFAIHSITWRALPTGLAIGTAFGSGLAAEPAGRVRGDARHFGWNEQRTHLVQMVASTIVRAHVSAAGAKGSRTGKLSVARAAAFPAKST